MADFTETDTQRVTLFDQNNVPLVGSLYTVTSTDDAIAEPIDDGGGHWALAGRSVGTVTVHVSRNSDSATGTDKTLEITSSSSGVFEWHFGTAVPQ